MLTDRLTWLRGCLVVPLFLSVSLSTANNDTKGFLVTGPKHVLAGTEETYCLHLRGVQSAGEVFFRTAHKKFRIYIGDPGHYKIDPKINDYNRCIPLKFTMPPGSASGTYEISFSIRWHDSKENLKAFTSKQIIVSSIPRNLLLIQTDKEWYTPGQLVRFRTLALTHVLQPVLTPPERVWITDPKNRVAFEWKNVTVNLGLAQLELQLSAESIQGVWNIHVKNGGLTKTKEFEVKIFVLPSFEVKIGAPNSVMGHEKSFDFSVCAKSTAGQPVLGTVDVVGKLQPRMAWFGQIDSDAKVEPVTISGKLDTGCLQMVFPLSRLAPDGDLWSHIEITGHVTEAGTGEKRKANVTVAVAPQGESNIFIEKSSRNPTSFQIGLPYVGQKTIANASVHICVQEGVRNLGLKHGDPVYDIEAIVCHHTYTDDQGIFKYSILPRKPETLRLNFQFTYIDEEKNLMSSQLTTIKASHSLSGSYATILSAEEQPVACDSKLALKVYFNNIKPGEKLDLHYVVTGRGDVLEHGTKSVEVQTFSQELSEVINLPKKSFDEKIFNVRSPVRLNGIELEIQVTPSFSPKSSIMVYYIREDGELVAAQTEIKVKECFPNPVTLHWNVDQESPGATAELTVQSTPGSLCGLSVVDQSVTLIKPSNQLTANNVFEQIKPFHIESFNNPSQHTIDYRYCETNTEPETPRENPKGLEGSWSSASVHEDVIQAFDLETRPCYSYFTEYEDIVLQGVPAGRPPPIPERTATRGTDVADTEESAPVMPLVEEHVYFPDTLLWDLRTVDETGSFTVQVKLPTKATSWVGRALCLSNITGFGMSTEAKITAAGRH